MVGPRRPTLEGGPIWGVHRRKSFGHLGVDSFLDAVDEAAVWRTVKEMVVLMALAVEGE